MSDEYSDPVPTPTQAFDALVAAVAEIEKHAGPDVVAAAVIALGTITVKVLGPLERRFAVVNSAGDLVRAFDRARNEPHGEA